MAPRQAEGVNEVLPLSGGVLQPQEEQSYTGNQPRSSHELH